MNTAIKLGAATVLLALAVRENERRKDALEQEKLRLDRERNRIEAEQARAWLHRESRQITHGGSASPKGCLVPQQRTCPESPLTFAQTHRLSLLGGTPNALVAEAAARRALS